MKKGIIIYKSKYGTSKKYAEWLAEEIDYDLIELTDAKINIISQYQNIVLCGAIYAQGISCISYLKKHFNMIRSKNIAIFCVGASPFNEKAFNEIKAHNLQGDLQNISLFYGRGIWDESKMTVVDRTLCKMLQKFVLKKSPVNYEPWEEALVNAIGKTCDWTDRKYLEPLVELVQTWGSVI